MSLDHFILWFTEVSCGVGGAGWANIVGICRVLALLYICWVHSFDPVGVSLWCMHRVCIARFSILGSIGNSGGIVGSSYVMVLALKWAITCESGKGPSWGLRL